MNQKDAHQVTLHIRHNRESFVGELCYLAGSLNNWSVNDFQLGELPPQGEELSVILHDVPAGSLELKVTRGSWRTLQCSADGRLLAPYTFNVNHDVEFSISIDGWRDEFPSSTASPQVTLLDENFYFPNLGCHRKVWMYLPKGYAHADRSYPVLYMHDGQHLFDEATSVGRAGPVEWMVDETIDAHNGQVIVVAVDHAASYTEREQEFLVHSDVDRPTVKGEAYLKDIVTVLKPYVDQHFRTIPDRTHTAMLGSSLGGLITLYAGLYYPKVFGTLGIFSPSIWMDREGVYRVTEERTGQLSRDFQKMNLYFYVGGREKRMNSNGRHENMARDVQAYVAYLADSTNISIQVEVDQQGKHGAQYWQQAFRHFYQYWEEITDR